ncbi:hypothetical protein ACTWP5_07740 [Streptomyces sp. 4N509B]|uniref:hypothetical protein n=1 Tax=Streptomyces sp. 4N509B TaxID=3457413 RepID=UPI003FD121BF
MASAATVDHRALDGVAYRLTSDLDLGLPSTSVADVTVDGHLVEFTAGPAALGDDIAQTHGISAFDTELSFRGGTVRTATQRVYDPQTKQVERPTLVVWRGAHHSLVTRLYRVTTRDVLGMLRTLRLTERADGLTLDPDRAAGSGFARPASVIKEVPGLGLLEMTEPTRETTAQLPPWKGLAVRGGELYRDTLSDGRPFFVLSARTVWATVVPLAHTTVEEVPGLVRRLDLSRAE